MQYATRFQKLTSEHQKDVDGYIDGEYKYIHLLAPGDGWWGKIVASKRCKTLWNKHQDMATCHNRNILCKGMTEFKKFEKEMQSRINNCHETSNWSNIAIILGLLLYHRCYKNHSI